VSNRTDAQKAANEMDRLIFHLILLADAQCAFLPANSDARATWNRVYLDLRASRYGVRLMMHPADREGTEG